LVLALASLLLGMLFGLLASLQYINSDFLKEYIAFNKMRPFHVTTVVSWIVLCATGSIYFFITHLEKITLYSQKLVKVHLIVFLLTGLGIYISFFIGKMEGREYLSYSPILTIPILLGWVLFGINYFKTITKKIIEWPVYYWMWGTGIVFMIYHLCEAHLWVFPYFREYFIKDISVQWKSYGSFVGSWNMLVYGTAIYIMAKIKNDKGSAKNKTVFFFYFLGLTNLMFGWAHHTYLIPTQPWVRYVAYAISMTEWIVLGHIIYSWVKSLSKEHKDKYNMAYKFLKAADFWVFINIILALLFSIPAINYFTHGTHITVAHSMGTTIGINTTILLASLFFITQKISPNNKTTSSFLTKNYCIFNISLFLFFCTLIYAGIKRSNWMYFSKDVPFSKMQDELHTAYIAFFVFGLCLVFSMTSLSIVLLKRLMKALKGKNNLE
jgi:nitric oxide reductase subunit B